MSEKLVGVPQGYEKFEPSRQNLDLKKIDQEARNHLSLEWADYVKKASDYPKFGQHLGQLIVETLEKLNFRDRNSFEKNNLLQYLENNFLGYYRQVFRKLYPDPEEAQIAFLTFRNGFLAEYATARSFFEKGYQIFHSQDEEDLKHKVDLWLLPKTAQPSNKLIAIQVKSLNIADDPDSPIKKIWPIRSAGDVDSLVNQYGQYIKDNNFPAKGRKMLTYCQGFTNVRPVYALLPASGGTSARFNPTTGEPDIFLMDELDQEIQAVTKGEL